MTSRVREVRNEVRSNTGVQNDTYGALLDAFSFSDIAASTALWAVVLSKDADEYYLSDSAFRCARPGSSSTIL